MHDPTSGLARQVRMRRFSLALGFALLLVPATQLCAGTLSIIPTTTLAAETSNNTSTASSFASQSNGNLGATNVSKVNLHSLLYAGASTKIYAHLLVWFGGSNHMNVGYSSSDAAQVHAQVTDMISRGIDGVIIDWYGSGTTIDEATKLVMAEAEAHPGFTFAIMVDQGTIKWDSCSGCTPQQALIAQLQYVEQTYFPSPAYMTMNGSPVVTNFDIDSVYSIDWNAVNAALATKPTFIFQNNSGFTHVLSGGSYSWVMPTTGDFGMGYLADFYNTGKSHSSVLTTGATYKGFNDTLASWGENRIMGQQCGQTWLQTFSKINSLYSPQSELPWLQLVTWNDYEEGTEIESGIDNCASLTAATTSNSLQWTLHGDDSTIDHYTVYASTDGQNLMALTEMQPGTGTLDVCSYSLAAGNYTLYVQATGKPSVKNLMSGAVAYTPTCAGPPPPAPTTLTMSATPGTTTVTAGEAGAIQVAVTAVSGAVNDPVQLSCSGLPATISCSFLPASVIPGKGTANATLTVAVSTVASVIGKPRPASRKGPVYALLIPFGFAGFVFMGGLDNQRLRRWIAVSIMFAGMFLLSSCGGGQATSMGSSSVAPGAYTITIQGTNGTIETSTTAVVVIR